MNNYLQEKAYAATAKYNILIVTRIQNVPSNLNYQRRKDIQGIVSTNSSVIMQQLPRCCRIFISHAVLLELKYLLQQICCKNDLNLGWRSSKIYRLVFKTF